MHMMVTHVILLVLILMTAVGGSSSESTEQPPSIDKKRYGILGRFSFPEVEEVSCSDGGCQTFDGSETWEPTTNTISAQVVFKKPSFITTARIIWSECAANLLIKQIFSDNTSHTAFVPRSTAPADFDFYEEGWTYFAIRPVTTETVNISFPECTSLIRMSGLEFFGPKPHAGQSMVYPEKCDGHDCEKLFDGDYGVSVQEPDTCAGNSRKSDPLNLTYAAGNGPLLYYQIFISLHCDLSEDLNEFKIMPTFGVGDTQYGSLTYKINTQLPEMEASLGYFIPVQKISGEYIWNLEILKMHLTPLSSSKIIASEIDVFTQDKTIPIDTSCSGSGNCNNTLVDDNSYWRIVKGGNITYHLPKQEGGTDLKVLPTMMEMKMTQCDLGGCIKTFAIMYDNSEDRELIEIPNDRINKTQFVPLKPPNSTTAVTLKVETVTPDHAEGLTDNPGIKFVALYASERSSGHTPPPVDETTTSQSTTREVTSEVPEDTEPTTTEPPDVSTADPTIPPTISSTDGQVTDTSAPTARVTGGSTASPGPSDSQPSSVPTTQPSDATDSPTEITSQATVISTEAPSSEGPEVTTTQPDSTTEMSRDGVNVRYDCKMRDTSNEFDPDMANSSSDAAKHMKQLYKTLLKEGFKVEGMGRYFFKEMTFKKGSVFVDYKMNAESKLSPDLKGSLITNIQDTFARNNITVIDLDFSEVVEGKEALIIGLSAAAGFVALTGLVVLVVFTATFCRKHMKSKEEEEREQTAEWEPQPRHDHQQMPFGAGAGAPGLHWERRPSMSSSYNWSVNNRPVREFDSPPSVHSAHHVARAAHGLRGRPVDPYSREADRVEPHFGGDMFMQRGHDNLSNASSGDTPRTYFEDVTRHRIMPQIHVQGSGSESGSSVSSASSMGSAGSRSRSRRRDRRPERHRDPSPMYSRTLPTPSTPDSDLNITAEAEEIIARLYIDLDDQDDDTPPTQRDSVLHRRGESNDSNNNLEALYARPHKKSKRRNDETGEGEEGDDDVTTGRASDLISDYSTTNNKIFNVRKYSNGSSGLGSMPSSAASQNGGKYFSPTRRPRLDIGAQGDPKVFRRQTSRTSSDQNAADEALQLYYIDSIPETEEPASRHVSNHIEMKSKGIHRDTPIWRSGPRRKGKGLPRTDYTTRI